MRLTLTLHKQSLRWMMKQMWKRRGVIKEPSIVIPRVFVDKDIIDAAETYVPRKPGYIQVPPAPDDPQYAPETSEKDHPDYHEEAVYSFGKFTRLLEGLDQACLLTKTQAVNGLPKTVEGLVGKVEIPNQDELVQRYIMQAHKWDPTKDKLPKRFNRHKPGWKFKREYGIPASKTSAILMQNMMRLCQSLGGRYSDLLESRRFTTEPYVTAFYHFQGDKHVQIQGMHEALVGTNRPLEPFASEETVDDSVSHTLPDLYPVSPTIDLAQTHIWRLENKTVWSEGFTHAAPHTLLINNTDLWNTDRRNARALLFCFAHCLAYAKEKYGWDVKSLPEPISMQCIHGNGVTFNFVCFQLNTLNFDTQGGIKNMVWFDNDNMLFDKILPKTAMLRLTRYEDYDPEVFKKFLAFYINGAKLT